MPGQGRARLWVAGMLGVAGVAALGWFLVARVGPAGSGSGSTGAVVYDANTPLPALISGLRAGDARPFLILLPRMAAKATPRPQSATDAEAKELIAVLNSMRTGFLRFGSYGRISSVKVATKVLERLAVEPAPACWFEAMRPAHDLFASGLADADLQTRMATLAEVGRFWSWFPGRTMMAVEEETLVGWKSALYAPVVRRLADREPLARAAAVACLGLLPDDQAASPAVAYLEDRSDGGVLVRKQVLGSFAGRPVLLTEDMILKRLHDPDPDIVEMAELILKTTRGLTPEQVELGRLIFDPQPVHRAAVIPRLRNRTDIDPVVWLLQLSHDAEATVRLDAARALAERPTPEVLQRLGEMARSDQSPAVRQTAVKLLPPGSKAETATALPLPIPAPRKVTAGPPAPSETETTVALPPLPGSPSLNPKAN